MTTNGVRVDCPTQANFFVHSAQGDGPVVKDDPNDPGGVRRNAERARRIPSDVEMNAHRGAGWKFGKAAAIPLAACVLVAACSSSGSKRALPGTTGTSPTAVVPTSASTSTSPSSVATTSANTATTTASGSINDALAAYRASWAAFVALATDGARGLDDPELSATTADPLLTSVRQNIAAIRAQGRTERGAIEPHPTVVRADASVVVVNDCVVDTLDQFDSSGNQVTPPGAVRRGFLAEVDLDGTGHWKVTKRNEDASACAATG